MSAAGRSREGPLSRSDLPRSNVRSATVSESVGAAQREPETAQNALSSWQSALASAGIFPADAETERGEETSAEGVLPKIVPEAFSSAPGPIPITIQASSGSEAGSPASNLSQLSYPALMAASMRVAMGSRDQIEAGSFAPGSIAVQVKMSQPGSDARRTDHAWRGDDARRQATAQSAGKPKTADESTTAADLPMIATTSLILGPNPTSPSNRAGSAAGRHIFGSVNHAAELLPVAAQGRSSEGPTGAIPATAKDDAAIQTGKEHAQPAPPSSAGVELSGLTRSSSGSSDAASPNGALPVEPTPAPSAAEVQHGSSPTQNSQRVPTTAGEVTPLVSSPPAGPPAANLAPGPSGVEGQSVVGTSTEGRGKPKADGATVPTGTPSGHVNTVRATGTDTAHSVNVTRVLGQDQPGLLPAREPSGMPLQPNAARGSRSEGESSSSSTGETGVYGTFRSLDAAGNLPAPSWVHAGARTAEAGFQDQDLGWVRVRAQLDPSGVHAALVPGSPYAAQVLGGHLAGLDTYLTEHHTAVQTLSMVTPESHGDERGMEQGSGQSAGQGNGTGRDSDRDANQDGETPGTAARSIASTTAAPRVLPGGATISVMA